MVNRAGSVQERNCEKYEVECVDGKADTRLWNLLDYSIYKRIKESINTQR